MTTRASQDKSPVNLQPVVVPDLEVTNHADLLKARGLHHAALLVENPVVADGLRLSDFFDLIDVKTDTYGCPKALLEKYQDISEERFHEIVVEAFNNCASHVFKEGEASPPSLEERACIVKLLMDETVNPLIHEKPIFWRLFNLREDRTDFILNLGLLSPLPSFVRAQDLLMGVGRPLKRLETLIEPAEQEGFFRRTVERALACYNATEGREWLEADVYRTRQPIEDQVFNQIFDLAASQIDGKLNEIHPAKLKQQIFSMVQDARHTFLNRNGGDVGAVLTVLEHLVEDGDYSRKKYHHDARADWIESLKSKHPITYISVEHGYTPLVERWPLTPLFSECLRARKK